jgi:hypothetical protein
MQLSHQTWVLGYVYYVLTFLLRARRYDYEELIDEWDLGEYSGSRHGFTIEPINSADPGQENFEADDLYREHLNQLNLYLRNQRRDNLK